MIALNTKFKKLGQPGSPRYKVITGGRAGAKSFGVSTYTCRRTRWAGHKTLYTRYTMTSAEESIIPEIQEKIDLMGYADEFYSTKKRVYNTVSKSSIIFSGIQSSGRMQTAKLKGLKDVDLWVLDEAEELVDEDVFNKIDLSIRHPTSQNEIILILNPTNTDHWIWKRWFENSHYHKIIDDVPVAMSTHPEIEHIHFTYLDNLKHLPDDYVNGLRQLKTLRPKRYAHEVIGSWLERQEGVVFENWMEGPFDFTLPYCYALDWGYYPDPLAIIKVAVDPRRRLIFAKEITYSTKINDVVELFKNSEIKQHSDLIVCDHGEDRTMWSIQDAGYNIQKAVKNEIKNDVREINDWTLIIDPTSYNLKKELNNYIWNDKKSSIPIGEYNHLLDGLRYAFNRLVYYKSAGVRRTN